ncbi:Ypt/Rab-GAP domain of gyp1p superfamily protein [Striga asiatica]|uniref:Ypt/Rab-GAP domain of gyp1p superfamily protein n=1 Tax=Striga asiatica TaxID=4170 RepID=A0A5A7PZ24_STRAF|nr:Ypt/Rab-GAP domain of gyp1p superfamily protein [Striga asiatica]
MQHEKELLTLRFNRMNSVRVEYALWSIEGPKPQRPSTPAPKSYDRRTARLSRTRLKKRRAPSQFTTLPTNGRGVGEGEPTENPNRCSDPFIVHSLGLGMNETNQKCFKRSRETDRSATTRTRVGGVLSVSYHLENGDSRTGKSDTRHL